MFAKKMLKNYLNFLKITRRFAGHSKWANIRHIKGEKDAQRSELFLKLSRQMKVAIKEGNSADPKSNIKLDQLIQQAKRFNMPSATINNVLRTAAASEDKCSSYLIEIKGPGGCILLCEVYTDKLHYFKQTTATILRKNGAKYADSGVKHLFEEKGIVQTEIPKSLSEKSEQEILEKATDDAIESGAEDVKISEGVLEWTCSSSSFSKLQTELEKLGYVITNANVEFIPIKLQSLSDQELEVCASLYQKLQALPEVVKISDNIA